MTERITVEASGETVAEAKASALSELRRRVVGLDERTLAFEVVTEGQRGLLGVGSEAARVRLAGEPRGGDEDGHRQAATAAARVRGLVEKVSLALGVDCAIEMQESEARLDVLCAGEGAETLVGAQGETLDAIQVLAGVVMRRSAGGLQQVVVDAGGYRARRQSWLEELAERSAVTAATKRVRVSLEPMSASERKLVHGYLERRGGVITTSEGVEPHRYVVVDPA